MQVRNAAEEHAGVPTNLGLCERRDRGAADHLPQVARDVLEHKVDRAALDKSVVQGHHVGVRGAAQGAELPDRCDSKALPRGVAVQDLLNRKRDGLAHIQREVRFVHSPEPALPDALPLHVLAVIA